MGGYDESIELAIVERFVKPGARVIEGGSGVDGVVTKSLMRKAKLVVAVDPIGIPKVTYPHCSFQAALGLTLGEAVVFTNSEWWNTSTVKPAQWGESRGTTAVKKIDTNDIIGRYKIDTLVLDVEGAEYEIIPHVMSNPLLSVVIAEIHPWYTSDSLDVLLAKMSVAGFAVRELVFQETENWLAVWEKR